MQIMMGSLVCSTEFELKKIIWLNSFLLDQREFLIGFALTSTGSIREKLKYVFRTYDHDKDGVINKKEIDRMIKVNKISFKFCLILLLSLDCDESSCKRWSGKYLTDFWWIKMFTWTTQS